MGFSKFVEIGRVACIKRGVNEGKLVVILDVLNLNRVLVEGADSQNAVQRTVLPIKSLALTAQKINILRSVKTSLLKKAIQKEKVEETYKTSKASLKFQQAKKRESLNDFCRFKVMVYKRQLVNTLKRKLSNQK